MTALSDARNPVSIILYGKERLVVSSERSEARPWNEYQGCMDCDLLERFLCSVCDGKVGSKLLPFYNLFLIGLLCSIDAYDSYKIVLGRTVSIQNDEMQTKLESCALHGTRRAKAGQLPLNPAHFLRCVR